jgi:peptide/nickel transport system substrate-binding protein
MSSASQLFMFLGVVLVAACAPAVPSNPSVPARGQDGAPAASAVQRTLVVIGGRAPDTLAAKQLRDSGGAGNPRASYRAFNAALAISDERDIPRAYLAEKLPELNTDDWRVSSDGRMETTFRLRPDLTWHDGRPLTGDDFVFAHRVYASPEFGTSGLPPITYMEEVRAPDARTVVIRWKQPYAQGNALVMAELMPLPRHLLEQSFVPGQPDAFAALPFWISEYVGLGPYRLTRYELGSFAEATAFPGHALGKAKIDQLRLLYMPDANTALANLLSEAANVATDNSIDLQQAIVLDREWGPRNAGVVLKSPVGVRHGNVNLRPEIATPRTLTDLRVRRALAHSTDRQTLADGLTEGMGSIADTLVLPQVEYFADLDRVITKYPFDPRRVEQLLNEVGYTKGGDGIFVHPSEGRFAMEMAVAAGARNETEVAVIADGLKRQGIDASIRIIPRAQVTEPFIFAHFPGVLIGSHNSATIPPLQRLRQSEIATPENRGRGANYSGWVHPEAERLINLYETTLNRAERNQHIVQLLKLVTDEVPIYALYHNLEFIAHTSNLRGPAVAASNDGSAWNIHEWYWER